MPQGPNSGGIATFHDVETGTHRLEIHISGDRMEQHDLILESPSGLTMEALKSLDVLLPVISVILSESTLGNIIFGYFVWSGKRPKNR